MTNPERLKHYAEKTEAYLEGCFRGDLPQKTLFDAMRYSLLAGGKRLRPALVLEFCRVCGGDWEKAIPFAAALEMVHTYSLIHDDLPCMDNDDYRRGRLTNHKVYGEAVATLAGDALLTAAFSTLAESGADEKAIAQSVRVLAESAGERGMVGGQVLDMEGEDRALTAEQIHTIHALKTGCLIRAACCIGVIAANGTAEQMQAAERYATALGLAFQIRDDMLDVLGDAKTLGKATHADAHKSTFVSLYGLSSCEEMVRTQTDEAVASLSVFPDREFLTWLAKKMADRTA